MGMTTVTSFGGGLNVQDAPQMTQGNQCLRSMDVLTYGQGVAQRRSGFVTRKNNSGTPTVFENGEVIDSGRFDYQADTSATIYTVAYEDHTSVYYAVRGGGARELFRHNTVAKKGDNTGGFTPPPSGPDHEDENVRHDTFFIACTSFAVALTMRTSGTYGAVGPHQFAGAITTWDDEVIFWRVSLASTRDKDGFDKRLSTGELTHIDDVEPFIKGNHTLCASVYPYTFMAGRGDLPQHLVSSRAPKDDGATSHTWRADSDGNALDIVHIVGSDKDTQAITKLIGLNGQLCIVKERSILMMTVAAKRVNWRVSQRASVGTQDGRSVALYEDSIVFANRKGVYKFDGATLSDLSSEHIGRLWRTVTQGYDGGWDLVGTVFEDYYIVSIADEDGVNQATFVCHLPTRTWTQFSNMNMVATCPTEGGSSTYAVLRDDGAQRVADIGRCFRPDTNPRYIEQDPFGVGPTFDLEVGVLVNDDPVQMQHWTQLQIDHCGQLAVSAATGLDPVAPGYCAFGTTGAPTTQKRWRRAFSARTPGLRVRFQQVGQPAKVRVAGIQLQAAAMRSGSFYEDSIGV